MRASEDVEEAKSTLTKILVHFARYQASPTVRDDRSQCTELFKMLMREGNSAATKDQEYVSMRKWRGARDLEVAQMAAVVAWMVLPGLADLMRRDTSTRGPKEMEEEMVRRDLVEEVEEFGAAAVFLDYYVVRWMANHPHPEAAGGAQPRQKQHPPSAETLNRLAEDGYLAKALTLALMKLDAEGTDKEDPMKASLDDIKKVVTDKYPPLRAGEARPTTAGMPSMDWATGRVEWKDGAEGDEQRAAFGRDPVFIDKDVLLRVVKGLNRQSAAGVSCVQNAYLRRVFRDDDEEATKVLLHFARMMTCGAYCRGAVAFLNAARLAVILKKEQQGGGGEPDYRPLGLGCAVLRLINRTVTVQLTARALQLLQPFQSAVAVRDASLTIATMLQADFTAGRVDGVDGMDALLLDVANAFGTLRLDKALAALRKYMPELVRWFSIQHESRILLVHAGFGEVGYCETGLLQGDPLSMLVLGFALLDPVKEIQQLLKDDGVGQSPPRARAFADDMFGARGLAERMIPRVQEIEDIIEEGTGMKLQRAKTRVLLSKARAPDDAVFDLAVQFGIRRENVLVDGAEVMGCPVGTDEFIDRWMDVKVDDAVRDMAALKYFSDVHRWPVLLYCVNQRVTHLQRLLPLDLGKAQLKKFDDAITDEVFNIMGVRSEDREAVMTSTVHRLRGLPLGLGGAAMRGNDVDTRTRALRLARDSVSRYVNEHEPDAMLRVQRVWSRDNMKRTTIATKAGWVPAADNPDPEAENLRGHTLGRIPEDCVGEEDVPGDLDLDVSRAVVTSRVTGDAHAAELVAHTRVLEGMRNSQHQYQKIMAAHILSGSSPNTGHALRLVSHWRHKKVPMLMQQMLRMRFGVPSVIPLEETKCNCHHNTDYGGGGRFERAMECYRDDDYACGVHLDEEPLHGILCRRRQQRIVTRHDDIAKLLTTRLRSLPGVTVVQEPPAPVPGLAGARADLKVEVKARKWLIDVAVVCPASKSVVERQKSHVNPGVAAKAGEAVKRNKYKGVVRGFVVESGGRLGPLARTFIDEVVGECDMSESARRAAAFKILRAIGIDLMHKQAYMMAMLIEELRREQQHMVDFANGVM